MRTAVSTVACATFAVICLAGAVSAQPPGGRGGFGGPPGGPLERMLDDLKLTASQRTTALAAIRAYQENGRNLAELASAQLMLQMKEVLSPEEYQKLRTATNEFRAARGGPAQSLGAEAIVERILSFDKNKDGLISIDELPERMQYLMEKGDTNKDGFLDVSEIRKLAADLARDEPLPGGRGGRGAGGRGGLVGVGFPPRAIERTLDDLQLSESKKTAVAAAVKASHENLSKLTELARADLLVKMDELLTPEDYKKFKAAVDRTPGIGSRPPFAPPGRFRP